MRHCSVDLESLSVPENCYNPYVLSIGAVIFDDTNPDFRKYFYRRLNNNQKGKWDANTKDFWESLSPVTRKLAGYPVKEKINFTFGDIKSYRMDIEWAKKDPKQVLKEFRDWNKMNCVEQWWGNSPSFDMRIIDHLHESFEFRDDMDRDWSLPPWKKEMTKSIFWAERDVRSLKDLFLQFNLSLNEYHFYDDCKKDFEEAGIGRIFGVKHFALADCVEESAIVYTVKLFMNKIKAVLES